MKCFKFVSFSFKKVEKKKDHLRNTSFYIFATLTTFLITALYSLWVDALYRCASISSKRSNIGMDSAFIKPCKKNTILIVIFQIKHFFQSHVTSIWRSH